MTKEFSEECGSGRMGVARSTDLALFGVGCLFLIVWLIKSDLKIPGNKMIAGAS
jgi:hypothetical protein